MEKVRLNILGITSGNSTTNPTYTILLGESNGNLKLPIIIGMQEAQSIALAIEGIIHPRPLTHDLFRNFAIAFQINIKEIFIYKLEESVFYSMLICDYLGTTQEIDARTSDALSLAVRFKCPIFINKTILNEVGIQLDEFNDSYSPERPSDDLMPDMARPLQIEIKKLDLDELELLLKDAIENEDYDKAAFIRDEITKRKKK